MSRRDEHLYARVAMQAHSTRKRYAVLDRGCWSERPLFNGDTENNSQDFKGRIIDGVAGVVSAESKRIGFFHPLYCGYMGKSGVVEVVPNLDKQHHDDDYIAIGQGWQTIAAWPACFDLPPTDPCESAPCDPAVECAESHYVSGGWTTSIPSVFGNDDSLLIYDKLTMTHEIGPNEVPALLELYGYDGGPPSRPKDPKKPLLLSWAPNHSAFQYTFQICYRGGLLDRNTGLSPFGTGAPWWDQTQPDPCMHFDCCKMVDYYMETFATEWCQAILDDAAALPEERPWWASCLCFNALVSWAQQCCVDGEA
jgi:hypothetical protein